jgi:hypothetical protein
MKILVDLFLSIIQEEPGGIVALKVKLIDRVIRFMILINAIFDYSISNYYHYLTLYLLLILSYNFIVIINLKYI